MYNLQKKKGSLRIMNNYALKMSRQKHWYNK